MYPRPSQKPPLHLLPPQQQTCVGFCLGQVYKVAVAAGVRFTPRRATFCAGSAVFGRVVVLRTRAHATPLSAQLATWLLHRRRLRSLYCLSAPARYPRRQSDASSTASGRGSGAEDCAGHEFPHPDTPKPYRSAAKYTADHSEITRSRKRHAAKKNHVRRHSRNFRMYRATHNPCK